MKALVFLSICLLGLKPEHTEGLNNRYSEMNSVGQPTGNATHFSDWPENLSRFRTALLKGDKATVKSFFAFPIKNPGNDIWYVADTRNVMRMNPANIVPFQESDFDKYYSAILSMDFRKTLELIDIEKLAKEKSAESPELVIVSPATSKMKAAYAENKKTITLSLITKSPEFAEFTIDYHFQVLDNGNIRFSHVTFIL